MVNKLDNAKYAITNLGAILFAKDLSKFNNLKRKSNKSNSIQRQYKIKTLKEIVGNKGYIMLLVLKILLSI